MSNPKWILYTFPSEALKGQNAVVFGEHTATPGIIIPPYPPADYQAPLLITNGKRWRVTHESTGLAVCSQTFCRRTARLVAGVLGGYWEDWTFPTSHLPPAFPRSAVMDYVKQFK